MNEYIWKQTNKQTLHFVLLFIHAVPSVDKAQVIDVYLLSQAFQLHAINKLIFLLCQGNEAK